MVMNLDLGWNVWRVDERIRLRGVDAPERDTIPGMAATRFVEGVLALSVPPREAAGAAVGAGVPLVTLTSTGKDKYGRWLGIVRLADGRLLNDLLLETGHAQRA